MKQPSFNFSQQDQSDYDKEIIDIARVARTVKGGRRFSFRATVALGDKQGLIGVGVAKGKDVAQSIGKASKKAERKMIKVVREEGTIPVDIIGKFKSARVLLRPAKKGRGLIAGGVVRSLCFLAGIENISAKILSRTNNKINIAKATLEAFKKINQLHSKMTQKDKEKQAREKPKTSEKSDKPKQTKDK